MERKIKGDGTVGRAARSMARLCGGTAGIQAVPRSCASYWHARSARVPFAPAYDRPRRSTAMAERDEDSARLRPGPPRDPGSANAPRSSTRVPKASTRDGGSFGSDVRRVGKEGCRTWQARGEQKD